MKCSIQWVQQLSHVLNHVGISLPTCKGRNEWFYVVLAPYCGDLQELYLVSRQYCANFALLGRGCNTCQVEGHNLGEINHNAPLTNQVDSDNLIDRAVAAIKRGDRKEAIKIRKELKDLSLHP